MAFTAVVFAAALGFVGVMAAFVPVRNSSQLPVLAGAQIHRHWPVAATKSRALMGLPMVSKFGKIFCL